MSKSVDQTRCKRLNELMSDTGITQYALAKKTEIKQSNLSGMMRGRTNVSEPAAKRIAEVLGCRYQWLLGYDDFKTDADLVMRIADDASDNRKKKQALFALLSELGEWRISDLESTLSADLQELPIVGEYAESFPYARISNGETTRNLNRNDFERLVSKLVDYFNFELEHTCFNYELERNDEPNPAQ